MSSTRNSDTNPLDNYENMELEDMGQQTAIPENANDIEIPTIPAHAFRQYRKLNNRVYYIANAIGAVLSCVIAGLGLNWFDSKVGFCAGCGLAACELALIVAVGLNAIKATKLGNQIEADIQKQEQHDAEAESTRTNEIARTSQHENGHNAEICNESQQNISPSPIPLLSTDGQVDLREPLLLNQPKTTKKGKEPKKNKQEKTAQPGMYA